MGPRASLWFGVSVMAGVLGVLLLWQRFVARDPRVVGNSGALLFACCLFAFAAGAAVAGYGAVRTGR